MTALQGLKLVVQIVATYNDSQEGLLSKACIQQKYEQFKKRYPIIVMENLSGGSVLERLRSMTESKTGFSESDAAKIFRSFIQGVAEIHSRGIINCDLKLENLMFIDHSNNLQVKIIDFGLAISLRDRKEHFDKNCYGTPIYIARETLTCKHTSSEYMYSRATDIWQTGTVLYALLCMKYPFAPNQLMLEELGECIMNARYR